MERLESVCAVDTESLTGLSCCVLYILHCTIVRLVANVPGYKIGLHGPHPAESPRITYGSYMHMRIPCIFCKVRPTLPPRAYCTHVSRSKTHLNRMQVEILRFRLGAGPVVPYKSRQRSARPRSRSAAPSRSCRGAGRHRGRYSRWALPTGQPPGIQLARVRARAVRQGSMADLARALGGTCERQRRRGAATVRS
jgi:hypothetical protein